MFYAAVTSIPQRQGSSALTTPSRLPERLLPGLAVWVLSFVLLLLPTLAFATSVNLAWDPVSDAKLAGYKLYYGYDNRQYSAGVDVGKSTTASMSGLKDAKIYYFAVTAYDQTGNESGYSNEVAYDLSKVDSDGDGLSDWDEISIYRTDPNNSDTDGDGLSDGDEVKKHRTDPLKADTDGDGIPDGEEVAKGSDPLDARSIPVADNVSLALNAGGTQYMGADGAFYEADSQFSGGKTWATTASVAGTTDPFLYQTERYGNFSYIIPLANGNYDVTLKFAEIYFTTAGQRVFNVSAQGKTVIENLDLVAKVGPRVAYDVVVPVTVSNGLLNVTFTSVVNNAKVSSFKVEPKKMVFAVNAGGPQFISPDGTIYQADTNFSGGKSYSTTAAISGTADGRLYQSERYGNFSYAIPLTNGTYDVTLKFAEIYFTKTGQRVFNVLMEGKTVLSNLDLVAKVGPKVAFDAVIPVTVKDGVLNITFQSTVNNAKVSGITIRGK